jgi:YteA family regulatory protein
MQKSKLDYFRRKLEQEKERINQLLKLMIKNETIDSNSEISSELSFYDNHPSDMATELSDIERGMAFSENEKSMLKKVDRALENVKNNTYGICKACGKHISEDRLEFLPYAEYCVLCQNNINNLKPRDINDRPVEESVIGYPFGKSECSNKFETGFDSKDSYRAVESFNEIHNLDEYYDNNDDYVEPMEKISNQQYKDQLPD